MRRGGVVSSQLLYSTVAFSISNILGMLASLLTIAIIVRQLSIEDYAIFVVSLAFAESITIISRWGFPTLINRKVPKMEGIGPSMYWKIISTQLPILGFLLFLTILANSFLDVAQVGRSVLIFLGLFTGLQSISLSGVVTNRNLGKINSAAAIILVERVVPLFAVISIGILKIDFALYLVALALLSGPFLSTIFGVISILIIGKDSRGGSDSEISRVGLIKEGWPYLLVLIIIPLVANMDKFILHYYSTSDQVANYDIAWRLMQAGMVIVVAFRSSLAPLASKILSDKTTFEEIHRTSIGVIPQVIIPGTIFGFLFGLPVINTVFGQFMAESFQTFVILVASWSVAFACSPIFSAVETAFSAREFQIMMILGLAADFIVTLSLVGSFGALAAGMGTLAMQWTIFAVGSYCHLRRGLFQQTLLPIVILTSIISLASIFIVIIIPEEGHWNSVIFFSVAVFIMGVINGWKPISGTKEIVKSIRIWGQS